MKYWQGVELYVYMLKGSPACSKHRAPLETGTVSDVFRMFELTTPDTLKSRVTLMKHYLPLWAERHTSSEGIIFKYLRGSSVTVSTLSIIGSTDQP